MIRNKTLAVVVMVFFLSGCESFKVAGQFQSGRQAFLAKDYEAALASFQKVARADPNYMFESGLYRQGIWNYVGRAQYYTGKFAEASQSLERALKVYQDDHLAWVYLGLSRARSGDLSNGASEIERGMKGLYDWLEHYESSRPFEAFWDPRREIRSPSKRTSRECLLVKSTGNSLSKMPSGSVRGWKTKSMRSAARRAARSDKDSLCAFCALCG